MRERRSRRASVLIVVLITLMITAIALFAFIERASDNLLVEIREADARRLRAEAYSALETTVSVLSEFKQANGSLKSPVEGWGDPLAFADYPVPEGYRITVDFKDESGKLSLPHATPTILSELFKSWDMQAADADKLADALQDWCIPDYVSSSGFSSTYDTESLPFDAPARSLRSYEELGSIDLARDYFYDDTGRPNERFQRFKDCISLYDFKTSNLNGVRSDVLGAMGVDPTARDQIGDYLNGQNAYKSQGAGYFKSLDEASSLLGKSNGSISLGVDISVLRVIITVWDRRASYRLSTVITPLKSGAKAITTKANPKKKDGTTHKKEESSETTTTQSDGSSDSDKQKKSLNYPFTILEIRENDEASQPPTQP